MTVDTWTLYFDGYKLVENMTSFTAAFQAWFAVFWVYSVEYPKKLLYTCLFLEKFVFGRSVSVPGPVTRLANKVIMTKSTSSASTSASVVCSPALPDLFDTDHFTV
jgi:hypothetical protein